VERHRGVVGQRLEQSKVLGDEMAQVVRSVGDDEDRRDPAVDLERGGHGAAVPGLGLLAVACGDQRGRQHRGAAEGGGGPRG
jgi:hypothetical protein